jgi:tetratricopeptide (TPR) repeat protein
MMQGTQKRPELSNRTGIQNSSALLQMLSISLLLVACKKPPETATPVTIEQVVEPQTVDAESNAVAVDATVEEVQESEAVDSSNGNENSEEESIRFADEVNSAIALLTSGEKSVQLGLEALQNLEKQNASAPEIPYNIGVAQLKLGNERAAQKAFERAIEIDPTFSKAWFNLGVMLERNRKYEEAIATYETGLSHSETDPDLSAGKIACLRKLGRFDESIEYAQQVLGKNANNVAAYSEVGAVYLDQGNLDKALFVLQQAAARNGSENAKLQSILGQVYYAQEKLPQAEAAFKKSLDLDSTLIETSMYLAFLQLQNRAWGAAGETLDAALKLDPTNAALLNAYGVAKRGLGEIDEAERLYKEAYQLNPSNPEPLLNLAVLEADYRNEYTKAFDLLDRYESEGGEKTDTVAEWRSDFKESEEAYLKEKKQQELRELFRRRREEAAKKRAEEEAKRAAEEAESATDDTESVEGDDVEPGDPDPDIGSGEQEASEGSETSTDSQETSSDEQPSAESSNEGDTAEEGDVEEESSSSDDNGWGTSVESTTEEEGVDATETAVPEEAQLEVGDNSEDSSDSVEGVDTENEAPDNSDDLGADNASGSNEGTWGTEETVNPSESTDVLSEDEQNSNGTDNSDVTQEEPKVEDSGWGSPVEIQACSIQTDCQDDKVCSSTGVCLSSGEFGTTMENGTCSTSDECAISLSCVENICIQETADSDDSE